MAGYNLTQSQKDLARWIAKQTKEGRLKEEFVVLWMGGGNTIAGFDGAHPPISKMQLDALEGAGLVQCKPNITSYQATGIMGKETTRTFEVSRTCAVTGLLYEAVDSDFEPPAAEVAALFNIGAFINEMSGGNLQAVGSAQESEISQIVNDPGLLQSSVEALMGRLVDEVKADLRVEDSASYAQAATELKEQLLADKPQAGPIKRALRTLGFLGDVEGTIALIGRVWLNLYPLLLIAMERMS